MKSSYLIKKFILPIYNAKIIYVEYTKENFYKVLDIVCDKYGLNPEMENDLHLCHGLSYEYYDDDKGQHFYLFINIDYKNEYFDTFCHELKHLIDHIKVHYGLVEKRGKTNEHIAYMQGYLSNLLINKKRIK